MILDHSLVVSDAQALTATAGSTNVIDMSITGRKTGAGEPMAFVVFVDVAADVANANETYSFSIQTDDDVAFGSATTLFTVAIAGASLTAGSKHVLFIDPSWTFEAFARINYTLGGTTPSVTVTTALTPVCAIEAVTAYPNAYTITN